MIAHRCIPRLRERSSIGQLPLEILRVLFNQYLYMEDDWRRDRNMGSWLEQYAYYSPSRIVKTKVPVFEFDDDF